MRLIDADALKDVLNNGGGTSVDINISKNMPLGEIVDIVIQAYRKCLFAELQKKMPTAYDVDEVVERIKNCDYCDSDGYLEPDAVVRIVKEEIKA